MKNNETHKIYSCASQAEIKNDLQDLLSFQEKGITLDELKEKIDEKLIPHLMHYNHPEFQSLYNFFPEEGAEWGANIALQYNQGVTNWQVSPGAVMMEELCCQGMCKLFGLSPNSDATFMYCGTYANQQALYMALHRKAEQHGFNLSKTGIKGFKCPGRLAVLSSSEAHFSLKHAVRMLGLGEESLIPISVDSNFRMDVNALQQTVHELRDNRDIFCIVSTAGITSTGSIDPISPVVDVCEKINAWSHIDGAYGLAFRLLPEKKSLFVGLDRVDSVCWDPHKQFGVPIPNSLLFVQNKKEFKRMAIYGYYFNREDDPEPNPGLKSPPSTRPFSALPLVTTIRHQGMKKIRERLRSPIHAIQACATKLKQEKDFEVFHVPDTGLLCIRIVPEHIPENQLNGLQQYVFERIKNEGKRSISISRLHNQTVLRLVAISPSVTTSSLMETMVTIRNISKEFPNKV